MNEKNKKPRRDNPFFDKTEHDFLMEMKRNHTVVTVHFISGNEISGYVKSFGLRTVHLSTNGGNVLLYQHSISHITESGGAL